jgi:hypothetical protein
MAQTNRGARTRAATTEQTEGAPVDLSTVDVADADAQQVEVYQDGEPVVEGVPTSMTQQAARRAAEWVKSKGYGDAMGSIIRYIAANAQDTAELNAVIMEQMALRIINATSPEEILDPFATVKGEDLVGVPLEIRGAMFLEGDKNEGFPWYVTLTVFDGRTQREFPVTIGGEKLVPQVAGFDMHDAWPQVVKIMTYTTRAGFTGYELQRVDKAPY